MRPKRSDVLAVTTAETQDEGKLTVTESADYVQQRVAAVAEQRQEDSLMEAVRRNTEMLHGAAVGPDDVEGQLYAATPTKTTGSNVLAVWTEGPRPTRMH